MPDYNIYIHAIGTGSATNQNPTVPWSARDGGEAFNQTQSQSGGNAAASGINAVAMVGRAAAITQNPDALVGAAFSGAMKALPWIAAAYAVVKTGVSIADTAIEFTEIETGDYRGGNAWKDIKQIFNNLSHPFSSTMQFLKTTSQWERESKRARLEQDLLGGSVINSYTRRGV
jgi:hypothetical protein